MTPPRQKADDTAAPISTKQMRELHALLRDHGITGDVTVHEYLNAWLLEHDDDQHPLESRSDLHTGTAARLIRDLRGAAVTRAPGGLARALIQVQAALPLVQKNKTATISGRNGGAGYSYTYADLADVTAAAMPLLTANGLAFMAAPRITEKGSYELAGILLHDSGEQMDGALPLHGNDPQQIGGALTYFRRYLLGCMIGIVTDDDADARQAMGSQQTRAWDGPSTADLLNQIDADATRAGATYEQATAKLRAALGDLTVDDLDAVEPWRVAPFAETVKAHADKVVAEREAAQQQTDAEDEPGPGASGEQPPA